MRGHHADNTARIRMETGSNYAQDDILAGEDPDDLCMTASLTGLHYTDSRSAILLHELGGLADLGVRPDHGGMGAGVHNRSEIGKSGLLAQRFDIGHHSQCLGVHTIAKLGLHALESGMKLGRGGGSTLELLESFMEYLGNVEQTNDIAIFVAHGLDNHKSEYQVGIVDVQDDGTRAGP